ncbi:hypothetical protein BD410DRAFT_846538 [Rickenella mellea]|uniref:Uncharacterized protein n=1 Tax=Rickenella mellea TaxID=50990 RepID=A0A4Y7PFR5_9AGAM|nr:hypothetical protein BD410DRAFT_846538 [Rickenella mellea]
MSKEARECANARRRDASDAYHKNLDKVWFDIQDTVEDLAKGHNKSINAVQTDLRLGRGRIARPRREKTSAWNAFMWKKAQEKRDENGESSGRKSLANLTQNTQTEYSSLTAEEKEVLVKEYEEHKAASTKVERVSTAAKRKDFSHTIGAVEKELMNLNARTGIECMVLATPGSTKLPLQGVYFTTPRVEGFLSSINMDPQDLLSRMEGFAVQGLRGTASSHKARMSNIRTELRNHIHAALVEATGCRDAKMKWKNYWQDIVSKYRVVIEVWPENIPFGNLSDIVTNIPDFERLLRKWKTNTIYFRQIDDNEYDKLQVERDEKLESGELEEPRRKIRSDKGKKRPRKDSSKGQSRKKARTVSSEEFIADSGDNADGNSDDESSDDESSDDSTSDDSGEGSQG